MATGNLYVISGPSGVGKGTLVRLILPRLPYCKLSVSATTRSPRPGETEGVSYFFLSEEAFAEMQGAGGFLESATFNNHRYGTPKQPVLETLSAGEDVLLEIDVQGALQVKESYPDAILVFIAPPSIEELSRRLHERGTETPEVLKERLSIAQVELSQQMFYDVVIVNDQLEKAADELVAFIERSDQQSSENSHKQDNKE